MKVESTRIPDVLLIEPRVFGDSRGFFLETWQSQKYAAAGVAQHFVQDNHSRSTRLTLRGLHYQIEHPQGKLVQVLSGEVFDVAVDLRRRSATFGQWVGAVLSADNHRQLWVPPGFAHGFLALSESVDFLYKCTDYWHAEYERCIRWDDPTLAITWPLSAGAAPVLSPKDAAGRLFRDAECFQ
jgi:dTDP-4-dehydrorhamnose 3,5-epimerase